MSRHRQCFGTITRSATLFRAQRYEIMDACWQLKTRGDARDSRSRWRPYSYRELARLAYSAYLVAADMGARPPLSEIGAPSEAQLALGGGRVPALDDRVAVQVTYSLPAELHSRVRQLERMRGVNARVFHRQVVLAFVRSPKDDPLVAPRTGILRPDLRLLSGNPEQLQARLQTGWLDIFAE